MKYAELKKHIAERKFDAAYYFTGSDEYLKSWSVRMFRGALGEPAMNYAAPDGGDERAVLDSLTAFPLLSDFRLTVIDTFPSDFSRLADYFSDPSPTSVLIILGFPEPRSAKKKQELESLKKKFTEIDCSPLGKDMLMRWIANEAKTGGAEVTNAAAELLIEYTRGDLSRISGELHKLSAYRSGECIEADDIKALVSPGEEYKIWELSNAVADKNRAKAMYIAEKFEEDKAEFVSVFGAVYKHFHNMFYVLCSDEDEAISALELNPGNYYRLKESAKKFGTRKLKNILYTLGDIDLASKSGRLDKSVAARTMITAIIDAL